jgi:hypothetical protein
MKIDHTKDTPAEALGISMDSVKEMHLKLAMMIATVNKSSEYVEKCILEASKGTDELRAVLLILSDAFRKGLMSGFKDFQKNMGLDKE